MNFAFGVLTFYSWSFFGLSASANNEVTNDTEEVTTYPQKTWTELITGISSSKNNGDNRLYHNDDTKTAFTYDTGDLPSILKTLINCSDTFDDGMMFGLHTNSPLQFPNADIRQYQDVDWIQVINHGAIVYVDDNGEEHSFSGFSDLENYIIQNYDVTVVDYDKYVEDGSIVVVDAITTPVNNTTATSYFTGDVNGDGMIDLIDAIALNKICAGFITPTDVQKNIADVNKDGSVGDDDVTILMQFLTGLRSDLTAE